MIRIGIIGCGYWGPNLVHTFHDTPEVEVSTVCDLRIGRLEFIQKKFPGIRTTLSAEEVIADNRLDAVVVATPPSTHYAVARSAIEAGKHLLIEKPMTLVSAQADELVSLADQKKRTLVVGHLFLYHSVVRTMRRMLRDGDLGEVYSISSTRMNLGPPNTMIDVLWDLAPHDVSIILDLMEEEPCDVQVMGSMFTNDDFAEVVFLALRFPSGRLAHIHVSWLTPNKTRVFHMLCSRKVIMWDDTEAVEKLRIFEAGNDNRMNASAKDSHALSYGPGAITIPPISGGEPLRSECEDFIHCIRTGGTPVSNGRKGVQVVRVLEAAEAQIRTARSARTSNPA